MKRIIPFLMTFLLLLTSCEFENNRGYPKKVKFPSSGGTEAYSGESSFAYFVIYDDTDEYVSDDGDSIITVSHDWLKAESVRGSKSITITAQPNNTGRQRKLKIFGYFGNEYAVINVTQTR